MEVPFRCDDHFATLRRRNRQSLDVGARLRAFREEIGLTQEVIARRAHVTPKFVSEIENGHANPSVGVLTRLIEHGLEIPISGFFSSDVVGALRDDMAKLEALFAGQSATARRRALRLLKAFFEE